MAKVKARATSIDRLVNPVIKATFTVLGAPVILAAKMEVVDDKSRDRHSI